MYYTYKSYLNNYDDSKHVLSFSKPERGLGLIIILQLALAPVVWLKPPPSPILKLSGILTCVRMKGGGSSNCTWPSLSPLMSSCNEKENCLFCWISDFLNNPALLNVWFYIKFQFIQLTIHFSSIINIRLKNCQIPGILSSALIIH